MSCTITYMTSRAPGAEDRAQKRGTLPRRPVRWLASVWMIAPNGEKTTHSITVPACTAPDLVPAIGERIDALAQENGNTCIQFGWTASAHGARKPRGAKR
ncbi:hypothetical protein [Pseudomonas panipatensis]|uniref:Uncharacterized protein n=1 Tax=Pseudomonas panipatensis TaxID=428992 RepID=A0A1G8CT60_9PSED|nr:hypothetical protein [Pseudomonas panipatensis]SDH48682.1 hypothetical protein SAMN05216272_101759 [Pseudomonas panipatensis]SMP63598.1 hypothetical protein SAMN06295951_10683 [Pseudomonas panipatensis]